MPRVGNRDLSRFASALLRAGGSPEAIATEVAESLVSADVRGHNSHGVRQMVSKYASEIDSGRIDPTAEPSVTAPAGPWAKVDGNLAYGQLVGREAVRAGIDRASDHGIGIATLHRCSHIGRVGEFAELACDAGMAFAAFVSNPGSAWVAPAGCAERRFSTNPIAIGVPTFDALPFPFVLDIATSQVAHGKIKEHHASGEPLPAEWVVDESGNTQTDATAFEADGDGALLPLGGRVSGYKGTGLAVMNELLAGNLTDGSVSGMSDVTWGNHATFVVFDLETVTTRERAAERAAAMAAYVRSSDFSAGYGPGPGAIGSETLLPGEPEHLTATDHRSNGIPFPAADATALGELAREWGVDSGAIPAAFE